MADYFLGGEGQLTPGDAAVALIVLEDGRYLMQHRDQKPGIFYPGHWGLFGGAIDADETPEIALRRELEEELGLSSFAALAKSPISRSSSADTGILRAIFSKSGYRGLNSMACA